ncbi:MAG: 16S rRNA (adenine(1518)-N(6)/adenine(1519)-N(6))-dimethyltransferase RsmA [Oscillospiraceae bacterium]|nr:16S rRNA (adenine(1518)-N(6)/adenine(1519)-N(6))-dimethyltransferase RsmA [Oscillospiraceae bacterium]
MVNIKEITARYNLPPKKFFGQNFLVNPEVAAKTAALSLNGLDGGSCGVVEVGPGFGALTAELCKIYKKAAAIEIDTDFKQYYDEELCFNNLKIIFADFLKTDLKHLAEREFCGIDNVILCANLPYYITTAAVRKIIREPFSAVVLLVQKEAADKLCAEPGSAAYCETSILVSYFGSAKKMFDVPPSNFYPQPKINSSIVRIVPQRVCTPKNEELFFKIIAAAFNRRRKTLVNAVSSGLGLDKQKISEITEKITGNKNIRGEEIGVKTFSDISDLI